MLIDKNGVAGKEFRSFVQKVLRKNGYRVSKGAISVFQKAFLYAIEHFLVQGRSISFFRFGRFYVKTLRFRRSKEREGIMCGRKMRYKKVDLIIRYAKFAQCDALRKKMNKFQGENFENSKI